MQTFSKYILLLALLGVFRVVIATTAVDDRLLPPFDVHSEIKSRLLNEDKIPLSQILIHAKELDHLSSIQYMYLLMLRDARDRDDKEAFLALIEAVDKLPTTETALQAQLWSEKMRYYLMDRNTKYLEKNIDLQRKIISLYQLLSIKAAYLIETINLAEYQRLMSRLLEARQTLLSIENQIETVKSAKAKLIYYSEFGLNAFYQRRLEEAIEYFKKGMRIAEAQSNNEQSLSVFYSHLGMTFSEIGRNDIAIEYFTKTYETFKKMPNLSQLMLAHTLHNLSIAYHRNEQFEEAKKYSFDVLDIRREIGDKMGAANSYATLARIYFKQKLYDQAIEYYLLSQDMHSEIGFGRGYLETLFGLIDVYMAREETYSQVEKLVEESLKIVNESEHRQDVLKAYKLATDWYEKMEKYDLALKYSRLHGQLYEEIKSDESEKSIEEIQAAYEIQKQQNIIASLKKEQELKDTKLMSQRYQTYILGLVIVLIFSILFIVKMRSQKFLSTQKQLFSSGAEAIKSNDNKKELMHRSQIENRLEDYQVHCEKTGDIFSVILGTIDDYDELTSAEPEIEEELWQFLTDFLYDNLRRKDLIARWQRDSFLILLPDFRIDLASFVLSTIEKSLPKYNLYLSDSSDEDGRQDLRIKLGCAEHINGSKVENTIQQAERRRDAYDIDSSFS